MLHPQIVSEGTEFKSDFFLHLWSTCLTVFERVKVRKSFITRCTFIKPEFFFKVSCVFIFLLPELIRCQRYYVAPSNRFWRDRIQVRLFSFITEVNIWPSLTEPRLWYNFFSYIDFVFDFSWSFSKTNGEIFHGVSMPRLWYNNFFLHWFCSWLFRKLQQKH